LNGSSKCHQSQHNEDVVGITMGIVVLICPTSTAGVCSPTVLHPTRNGNSKLFHFRLGKGLSFGKPAGCILGHNEQDVMSSVVRIKKGSWRQGAATRLQQARLDPQHEQQQQLFRQPEYRIGDARSNEYVTIRWEEAAVAFCSSLLGQCLAGQAQL
jgi:hypothetical protein